MDQGEKEIMQDRDKLIMDWMRSNESFKALARKYGKGGKITRLDDEGPEGWDEGLSAKVGALIDPEGRPAAPSALATPKPNGS